MINQMYCIKEPRGKLLIATTATARTGCWLKLFDYMKDASWREDFDAAMETYIKRGYELVECELKEVV